MSTYAAHTLQVPGRSETQALIDCCDNGQCLTPTEPVVVYDLPNKGGREAAYRCPVCGQRWVCWWAWPQPYECS